MTRPPEHFQYDVVVVGVGSAGLPAAIAAAGRGATVCLVEGTSEVGGTLPLTRGWMSGAGTRRQAERGIKDCAEAHFQDAMRQGRPGADPAFVWLACELQGPLIDWLEDAGFEMAAEAPRPPRTHWGVEEGRSILKALRPLLDAHVAAGRIDLVLNTEVAELASEYGAVVGVATQDGRQVLGRSVVLATGGYGSNPALFARLHRGAVAASGAHPAARGDGLVLGLSAGGALVRGDGPAANFGGVLDRALTPPRYRSPGGLTAEDRPPWEIVVNRAGERFYPEDTHDAEARARLLLAQPGGQAWAVYDEAIRREAPSLFRHFDAAKAESFYGPEGSIVSASSLGALAGAAGIEAAGLAWTVAAYNRAVTKGEDALGRRHLPKRIEAPPFHALPIMAYTVRSTVGLKVDLELRVLDDGGRPIPGLRAVGEVLGDLVGGMSLGSALAFGKYLGGRLPVG